MKIACVTPTDATNVANWSGLYYHIYKSLEAQGLEIELMSDLNAGRSPGRDVRKVWSRFVQRRSYNHFWDVDTARAYAADVEARLKHSDAEVVVSPVPAVLAYLKCPQPKVLWTDAGYEALRHDYAEFSDSVLSPASARNARQVDRALAASCDLLLYASEWGSEWAIKGAGADPARVATVPYGANLQITHTAADVAQTAAARGSDPIKFLFVGLNWERKGGAKAVAVVQALRERGINATLTLVGSPPPPDEPLPDFARSLGYLSKGTEEGRALLLELYQQSHFLLVPTVGEAYGLVFAEASAYGMPSLSHRVGGVPTIIRDGVNGYLFDSAEPVSAWADKVLSVLSDPEGLARLAVSSFAEYQARLNWEVAGRDAAARIRACLAAHRQTPAGKHV